MSGLCSVSDADRLRSYLLSSLILVLLFYFVVLCFGCLFDADVPEQFTVNLSGGSFEEKSVSSLWPITFQD